MRNPNQVQIGVSCVVRYINAKIQSLTAIFLFPGGQESSINSPHVPRMCPIAWLLNVRFRLLLEIKVCPNIIAKFLFPGGQESSIYSYFVPRICPIVWLLTVRFKLLLHLATVS